MPTFCRHGRMLATCPICSKGVQSSPPDRSPRPPRARSTSSRAPKAATGMRVRRLERAPEDGYDNWLVHGLRATADAVRLADELAFAEARLAELREDPPGLYAEVARSDDRDEAAWLAFEIAVIAPGRGGDAWSALEAARVPWAVDVVPEHDAEVFSGYRAWAERHGGQLPALTGEAEWDPIRRFTRTFERLAIRGLQRSPRFDFLVTLGALGVVAVEAGSLALTSSKPSDPVVLSAKRIMGIGDTITIERRLAELARETGVPFAALDLALYNWSQPEEERATMGARRAADPDRRAAIGEALGV